MSIKWGQLYSNPNVVIARSDVHGYGVFARKDLQEGDLIAQSPYFTLDEEDVDLDDDGNGSVSLGRYVHPIDEIEEVEGDWLIGLGMASLYNHSRDANIQWDLDHYNEVMVHYATCDIKAGEELFLDYGFGVDEEEFDGF